MAINVWKLIPSDATSLGDSVGLIPIPLPENIASLNSASTQLPGGAYTTFRTYRGCYALRLEGHFQRLEHTAALAGHGLILDKPALRSALRVLAHLQPAGADLRFRLTVDLERQPGEVYIAAEPLSVPSAAEYANGVMAITCDLQRLLPEAKLTRFIERAGQVRQSLPEGVNEAIMVDSGGSLREGLSSNFFAVRAGELWTADEGVLAGITRAITLDSARLQGLNVRFEPVRLEDLPGLDEAFITSASRGILPLSRIDQILLRLAAPGPVTHRLMQAFNEAIAGEIEPI